MIRKVLGTLLCCILIVSCGKEEGSLINRGISFQLQKGSYDGDSSASSRAIENNEEQLYDEVYHYIVDEQGDVVTNVKSEYIYSSAQLLVEGLHVGNYKLLVLAVKGNSKADEVTIHKITKMSDKWLSVPSGLTRALKSEYFYSQTPFKVILEHTEQGDREIVSEVGSLVQNRIVGCLRFQIDYNNPYVRTSMFDKNLRLQQAHFYTDFSADNKFSGKSTGVQDVISLNDKPSIYFMPTVTSTPLEGEVSMYSRKYNGEKIVSKYEFKNVVIEQNWQDRVNFTVQHPEDNSGVMFLTTQAYEEGNHAKILQDDEHHDIYHDTTKRSFNSKKPLQVSITDDGKLNVRFYSPRGLSNVMIKAKFSDISNEYLDFAYFDTIPPFADFYEEIPMYSKTVVYRAESGKNITVLPTQLSSETKVEFKVDSDCDYWRRLEKIKYGLNLYFTSHGGDPTSETGYPAYHKWRAIRPVHCREAIAYLLNFAYVVSMSELDEVLKQANNGWVDDNKNFVSTETILSQLRQERRIGICLTYQMLGPSGLASPSYWSVCQWIYCEHYYNFNGLEIAFHEYGHVMGYDHGSSFTYGSWAKVMGQFYLDHIKELPIDSPDYLNTSKNPHLYEHS